MTFSRRVAGGAARYQKGFCTMATRNLATILVILVALCAFAVAEEAAAPASAAGIQAPVESAALPGSEAATKYATMIIGVPGEEAFASSSDSLHMVKLLLEDPMVGAFPVDELDLSVCKPAGLEAYAESLQSREASAGLGLVYVTGSVASGETAAAGADYFLEFPGKAKVVFIDRTVASKEDATPALSVRVVSNDGAAEAAVFTFSGPASESKSPASLLAAALRGAADADRDRTVTLGELAGALKTSAAAADDFDLADLAGLSVLQYRTPSEMVKAIGADKALALAGKYEHEQLWIESLLVLRELKNDKLTDPEYRRISETAQLQLGLETRYSRDSRAENADRDVKAGLELVADVLQLTDLHYVRDVDNRELYAGGARNLELLLTNRNLHKALFADASDSSVDEFYRFVKESVDHVYEADALTENDFQMRVKRVIMENDATVKIPDGTIVTEFLYGITASLDPHTTYIPARSYKEFQDETVGHFGGLGIEITLEDKRLTVITPLDGTPASEAGLLPGDTIIRIEGQDTEGMALEAAVSKLRGPIGTTVTITITHRGDNTPIDVSLARANILLESIKGYEVDQKTGQWRYMIDPAEKIGYVRMTDFKESTPTDLENVLTSLTDEGMKGFVLDLRGNHGGLLTSGVRISDLFIPDGTIVSVRGAHSRPSVYKAHFFKTYKDFPVVVLMNDETASAAEILAGALQDHRRAELVGTQSFGKGTVQTIFELERGMSALKLTTAKYYTPNGVSIHREEYSKDGGLTPDVAVPMDDEQSLLLAEVLASARPQARVPRQADGDGKGSLQKESRFQNRRSRVVRRPAAQQGPRNPQRRDKDRRACRRRFSRQRVAPRAGTGNEGAPGTPQCRGRFISPQSN